MTKIGKFCVCLLLCGVAVAQSPTTSLQSLIAELRRNSPAIKASEMGVAAARYAPRQASALPDSEVMVQHFSVGSPRPFAGYSNSDVKISGDSNRRTGPGLGRIRFVCKASTITTMAIPAIAIIATATITT